MSSPIEDVCSNINLAKATAELCGFLQAASAGQAAGQIMTFDPN